MTTRRNIAARTLALTAALSLLLGLGFGLVRVSASRPAAPAATPAPGIAVPAGAAERLAGAVRYATLSHEDPRAFDAQAFRGLHAYLAATFPRVHAALEREVVGEHSLLYTWRGSEPELPGVLLMGHLDVVPVEPGTESQWHAPPFAGRIEDGFVWGRGAIDNKSAVVGLLEAVDMLLRDGARPTRTIYLAFGHDEEVGGQHGAREIAQRLARRGVHLRMVLDEGGVIADGVLPAVARPVALVGIAEKGFASIELTADVEGGHSSLPPSESAIGIVSAAVARIERDPMPARLEGPTRALFEGIRSELPLVQRGMFAQLWLTKPLVLSKLTASPTTNAMVRSTAAPTIFHAGSKDNVLPHHARAVINFRILPGDSVEGVLAHVRDVVDDPRVLVRVAGRFSAEPSRVSSTDAESYRRLADSIRRVSPDAVVAPYLVVVATDARHFGALADDVFRFLPVRLSSTDLARMHGRDERIAVRDYENAVRTYREILRDASAE